MEHNRNQLVRIAPESKIVHNRVHLATPESRELNRAFVFMQYFGYMQRNPDDPPDHNLDGLNFWLQKLASFGGDYQKAEMVRAFVESAEYRNRFGK